MKKSYIYLAALFLFGLTACKKELTQPEAIEKINTLSSQKTLSREDFENELLPTVNDLYEKDSLKYRIIHHIAMKAQQEKEKKLFDAQVKSLQAEMKFVGK
jgi:uncharacterized membrane protein